MKASTVSLLSVIDGRVVRIVALTALGMAVIGVTVAAVRDAERFYPGRTSGAHVTARYEIRADGDLDVTETIDYEYDESGLPLDRVVQLRRPVEQSLLQKVSLRSDDRVWKVSHLSATDRSGSPVPLRTKELDPMLPPLTATGIDGWDSRLSDLRIQLGDSKKAGAKTSYILRYRVHGALDWAVHGYELSWPDPTRMADTSSATEPRPPLDEVGVVAPDGITAASCTAYKTETEGASQSEDKAERPTSCATAGDAVFIPGRDRAAMTVKVAVPADSIIGGGAEYDGPPLPRSFRILLIAGAAVLLLVLVGVVADSLIRGFPLLLRRRA